ncbi:MAG: PQQ-like beta-propeller repeat protein, partial [Planctomycetes bacterium]|nr:PQQ-like beta-propeller repeat protein [Planctomycetota bacterium]
MLRAIVAGFLLVAIFAQNTFAAGWPMARGNAARSGYTSEALPENLSIAWTYKANHAPAPAWPRDDRMQFDRAYHVVVANGTLFFGSSVDGKVYALDAATGREKWTFFTEGPVRFAPVVWKDRLFVGSDDGYLYCLSTADGSLIRKMRGGPQSDRVLGNGHIISRRPVRGGPVILDDILYFAAGIWQSEGVYLYAVNPGSGKVLWPNDSSGG